MCIIYGWHQCHDRVRVLASLIPCLLASLVPCFLASTSPALYIRFNGSFDRWIAGPMEAWIDKLLGLWIDGWMDLISISFLYVFGNGARQWYALAFGRQVHQKMFTGSVKQWISECSILLFSS